MMAAVKWLVVVLAVMSANVYGAEKLSDKNIDAFLDQYADDYIYQAMTLAKGFRQYRDAGSYQGFVQFKNKHWQPEYDMARKKYDDELEINRKYLFDHGLTWIFSNFADLTLVAKDLFLALHNADNTKIDEALARLNEDMGELNQLFTDRKLDINKPASRANSRY